MVYWSQIDQSTQIVWSEFKLGSSQKSTQHGSTKKIIKKSRRSGPEDPKKIHGRQKSKITATTIVKDCKSIVLI